MTTTINKQPESAPAPADYLSFRLPESFLEEYKERPVAWGYTDAAGNSLGEITFLRTYSRLKEDGTKERWWEVCRRVVEGMFSIQKDHCKTNRLPWNDNKAQHTAQEAFERLFTFKWTPPGRGLWVMGTPLVNLHKNSAALQNCFRGDETLLTQEYGVVSFSEIAGETVTVMSSDGWRKAEVNSFGEQAVQRITFAPAHRNPKGDGFRANRSNYRLDVVATPNHRWQKVTGEITDVLAVGDVVPASASDIRPTEAYYDGFRHGVIFGDGNRAFTYANGDSRFSVRLCGDKAQHAHLFEYVTYEPSSGDDPHGHVRSSRDLKALPFGNEGVDYLGGFLDGWVAMDASRTPADSYVLATTHVPAAEWLRRNAALAGWVLRGDNFDSSVETNYGKRNAPVRRFTLVRPGENIAWKVVAIEVLPETETVYCVTVPETERFTLSGGVLSMNCAFVSTGDMTKTDPSYPFTFLMEASMLGIGVGFDNLGALKGFTINQPLIAKSWTYRIPDSREGWVESVRHLIESYLIPGKGYVSFEYDDIRPAGTPIKTFGGTAAGPGSLIKLHSKVRDLFNGRDGGALTENDIADLGNLLGVCVVSGNVRRSAELLIGSIHSQQFLDLKNYGSYEGEGEETTWVPGPAAYRSEWGWMSNNSVAVNVGDNLDAVVEGISRNGEPGVIWMDLSRNYGRLIDPPNYKDHRVAGYNPCAEQSLESGECCTLVETYLNRHTSVEDFKRTLKFAYMYAKTVTLLPTHWARTNAIMQRNRRIGTSVSGVANFADNHNLTTLRTWLNEGYAEVQKYDKIYSEWLCVRESIKTTTVKPSGTVSILAGESPGGHWAPGGEYFNRGIVFQKDDPMVQLFLMAGYNVEISAYTPDTSVFVQFPIHSQAKRSEKDVPLFEKANLAVLLQRYWSDNSVSVTLSFDKEKEADYVRSVLQMHAGQLKTVSFLPQGNDTYAQMPYQQMSAQDYEDATMRLFKVDLTPIYEGNAVDAVGESYCSTDTCLVKVEMAEARGETKENVA